MATIKTSPKRARVSKATVSRVLNSSSIVHTDKRDAVLKAMSDLGFQPMSSLAVWPVVSR